MTLQIGQYLLLLVVLLLKETQSLSLRLPSNQEFAENLLALLQLIRCSEPTHIAKWSKELLQVQLIGHCWVLIRDFLCTFSCLFQVVLKQSVLVHYLESSILTLLFVSDHHFQLSLGLLILLKISHFPGSVRWLWSRISTLRLASLKVNISLIFNIHLWIVQVVFQSVWVRHVHVLLLNEMVGSYLQIWRRSNLHCWVNSFLRLVKRSCRVRELESIGLHVSGFLLWLKLRIVFNIAWNSLWIALSSGDNICHFWGQIVLVRIEFFWLDVGVDIRITYGAHLVRMRRQIRQRRSVRGGRDRKIRSRLLVVTNLEWTLLFIGLKIHFVSILILLFDHSCTIFFFRSLIELLIDKWLSTSLRNPVHLMSSNVLLRLT